MNLYRPLYRPAHFSAMPKGVAWDYVEAPASDPMIAIRRKLPLSRHLYGIISTDRPLTLEELEQYELQVCEVDVCIAGAPAVNGCCGDPDCVCAPAGRYQIRVIADEHCTSVHDEVLAASDDLAAAKDLASEHSNWPYGSAIVDTVTGSIDYGDAADDAGRTAIGNTPTCECCGKRLEDCAAELANDGWDREEDAQ